MPQPIAAVQGEIAPELLFGAGLADQGVRDPRGWLGPDAAEAAVLPSAGAHRPRCRGVGRA